MKLQTIGPQTTAANDFIAISPAMLIPAKLCGVALYVREHVDGPVRLFRGADFPISQQDITRFSTSRRAKLYVASSEHHLFQQYLRENLNAVLYDESIAVAQRFDMLNLVVRDVLNESFRGKNADHTVAQARELSQKIVDVICHEDAVAFELFGVLYHDYYTFTHSANVAYYAVMLAKSIGVEKSQLRQIAIGGMLHDLGKLEIPDSVLTKPGKLTDAEFEIIKQHPTIGFRKLCKREDLGLGELMMVYQHHERMDGGGYPTRISGDEIHLWGRICAVVDVFEALTSVRPYRPGMPFSKAFEIMDRVAQGGFDRSIYECWKTTITRS